MFHILGTFSAGDYSLGDKTISGFSDDRSWKKNLLEVEQVQDFTAGGHNFGEVFVVKSEFNPTSYAIEGKWSPIYEYYTKNELGEMVRIGSGKMNQKTGKMETTISIDGKDRSNDIRSTGNTIEKLKEEGTVIQFDSDEYAGKSEKTSRKDIEQALTQKSIQTYLGKGKKISDITQIKDMPVVNFDEKGNPKIKNAYAIACVENGVESYEMVCINENGVCEKYPGMNQDIFANKAMHFPTGMKTGNDSKTSMHVMNTKQSLETFKSKDNMQYSVYRDKMGTLRVAQIYEHLNSNAKYAEELDTYSLMQGDLKKIKEESKQEYDRAITLAKTKQANKTTGLSLKNEKEDKDGNSYDL